MSELLPLPPTKNVLYTALTESDGWDDFTDYVHAYARACVPARATPSGWQDIATAPRDGMPILMALENGMVRTGRWSATRKYWILAYDGHVRGANSFPITGWMPLPEPPK